MSPAELGAIVGNLFYLWLAAALVFGLIGLYIGSRKNRTWDGLLLGALLNVVGLVIIMAVKPRLRAGWHADPVNRHDFRYYDGRIWTDAVSDRGTVSHESLPRVRELQDA